MRIPRLEIKCQETTKKIFDVKNHKYLSNAEEMYASLQEVLDGKATYCSHHMSMLANTIELYYKGILDLSIPNFYKHSKKNTTHNLACLYSDVAMNVMDVYPGISRYEENALYDYLKELSNLYIETRYFGTKVSKASFEESMEFLREQRDFVMSLVDPTKSWKQENCHLESEVGERA